MTADVFFKACVAALVFAVAPNFSPLLVSSAAAQDLRCDRGDAEVRGLDFTGNRTFTDAELANTIVTTPSAWARRTLNLPFSAKRCLDHTELVNDRFRLMLFYRRHGFPSVTVDTSLTPSGLGGVRVHFRIAEGAPVMLQSFVIAGLDTMNRRRAVLRGLPIRKGERFDRTKIDATMDTIARRLHNMGYPGATVTNIYSTRPGPSGPLADDSMTVVTGPFTRIGPIVVQAEPAPKHRQQIADDIVRRLAGVDSGSVYREQALADAQRALYQTDAYVHVAVVLDSAHGTRSGADSVAPLTIAVAENTMHAARVGAGYGTLDCFRANMELDNYNFLGRARRLELQGRVSKIGIGRPLDGAPQLCSQARRDPYSTRLNYYLGATLRQPFFFGLRSVPSITAYTSRVSEYNAYVRTTSVGGVASLPWQRSARTSVTFNYSVDFGRTEAQPALFCAVFNLCTQVDRDRVQQNQRLAVVSAVLAHDGANNPAAPTHGSVTRFEIRHASPLVFSDTALRFNTLLGDAAHYVNIGGGNVLALHVRAGAVFGRRFSTSIGFIPPQERMYAGGPTSVRGFPQNELGSATYIARDYKVDTVGTDVFFRVDDTVKTYRRAVPIGGNSMAIGNIELRLRSPVLPDILQFAIFTDAGDVWNRGRGNVFQDVKLKVTPGVQAAALTPVGPVRVIVGYNPYKRPPGPLYFENTSAAGGALPCVSPTNTLKVSKLPDGTLVQEPVDESKGKVCPAWQPASNTSFRSRLTFGLAIGQAF